MVRIRVKVDEWDQYKVTYGEASRLEGGLVELGKSLRVEGVLEVLRKAKEKRDEQARSAMRHPKADEGARSGLPDRRWSQQQQQLRVGEGQNEN